MLQTQRSTSSLPYAFIMCTATHLSDHNQVELQTNLLEDYAKFSQPQRRPLLGPSPGRKRLLANSHLRHGKWTGNWDLLRVMKSSSNLREPVSSSITRCARTRATSTTSATATPPSTPTPSTTRRGCATACGTPPAASPSPGRTPTTPAPGSAPSPTTVRREHPSLCSSEYN